MNDRAPLRLAYSGDPAFHLQGGVVPVIELSAGADALRGAGRRPARTARSRPEGVLPLLRIDGVELSEGSDRDRA